MIPFRGQGDEFVAFFELVEVRILDQLAAEVSELLDRVGDVDAGSASDRALGRLLPPAYVDDDESATEFRRFTSEGLADRKKINAAAIRASLAEAVVDRDRARVSLDAALAQGWLRSLTDIRLTLAAGLGIERDGDEAHPRDEDGYALEVYGWLGFVQESLLDAIER
ncbi:DUF2017 family protein [Agreia sp. COWG]|uniref:DUF2017 family protein n=1 Tax=Agreia sp. COWG TaxID=2773266 RepID=UPI001928B7C3|nr:DUF2017 family protein [Agreia sp. COWG]CAD6001478.1 conserved protein of unknown function [Agreia sp. COWG]